MIHTPTHTPLSFSVGPAAAVRLKSGSVTSQREKVPRIHRLAAGIRVTRLDLDRSLQLKRYIYLCCVCLDGHTHTHTQIQGYPCPEVENLDYRSAALQPFCEIQQIMSLYTHSVFAFPGSSCCLSLRVELLRRIYGTI